MIEDLSKNLLLNRNLLVSHATKSSITSKLANIFKKGIKRDPVLFSVLKEDNQWDS